jgi:hypothetical protein
LSSEARDLTDQNSTRAALHVMGDIDFSALLLIPDSPMWTCKNRARYDRSKLRYPSDLTDDEWRLVEPLIPPGKTSGGKRTVIMREVVNALMYYSLDRLSVARDPERPAAEKLGLRLLRPVDL